MLAIGDDIEIEDIIDLSHIGIKYPCLVSLQHLALYFSGCPCRALTLGYWYYQGRSLDFEMCHSFQGIRLPLTARLVSLSGTRSSRVVHSPTQNVLLKARV